MQETSGSADLLAAEPPPASPSPVARPSVLLPDRLKHVLSSVLPFLIVLFLWQVFSAETGARSIFLPSPFSVLRAFGSLFTEPDFYVDVSWSIYRITVGFVLSVLVAIPVGFLAGRFCLKKLDVKMRFPETIFAGQETPILVSTAPRPTPLPSSKIEPIWCVCVLRRPSCPSP